MLTHYQYRFVPSRTVLWIRRISLIAALGAAVAYAIFRV